MKETIIENILNAFRELNHDEYKLFSCKDIEKVIKDQYSIYQGNEAIEILRDIEIILDGLIKKHCVPHYDEIKEALNMNQ